MDLSKLDIDAIRYERSRRSLKYFLTHFWHIVEPNYQFVDNWHLDAICEHLQHIWDIKRLILTMPPRACKTLLTGVFFPAWQWIARPGTQFMYASYSQELSNDASQKCRTLVTHPNYTSLFPVVHIPDDQNTKTRFGTSKGGFRLATSVGGLTTGMGADVLTVDDAHNVKSAEFDTQRETVIRWFLNAFSNRLNDPRNGVRLVVGQRVHRYDLAGYLLANHADDWTHLNLPYERKAVVNVLGHESLGISDPRTEEKQELWPERFPPEEIKQHKANRVTWETQWNQSPVDKENATFRHETFRYWDEVSDEFYHLGTRKVRKRECVRIMACDLSLSIKSSGDYTVCATADCSPYGDIVLVGLSRNKPGPAKLAATVVEQYRMLQPARVLIEMIAFQRYIIEEIRRLGVPVKELKPLLDKEARAVPLATRFESGQVWFPRSARWVTDLEAELLEFPQSTRDDQVDALAYIAAECSKRIRTEPVPERPKTPEEIKQEADKRYREALLWGLR